MQSLIGEGMSRKQRDMHVLFKKKENLEIMSKIKIYLLMPQSLSVLFQQYILYLLAPLCHEFLQYMHCLKKQRLYYDIYFF